jgi:hypothetical protein
MTGRLFGRVRDDRVDRRGRRAGDAVQLIVVAYTAVIFPPGTLLRVPGAVCARKVRVDADFSTTLTAEEPFRPIRAGTIQRTGFLVGPFDFETLMRLLVSVHHSPPGNTAVNNGGSLAFRTENGGTGFPA